MLLRRLQKHPSLYPLYRNHSSMRIFSRISLFPFCAIAAIALLPFPADAVGCLTLRDACLSGGPRHFGRIDGCQPSEEVLASGACTEEASGKTETLYCCKAGGGKACTDTCITEEKCRSDGTRDADLLGPRDCPTGEMCCVFTPKSSASTEAAKEAGGAASASAATPEAPLKTANAYGYVPPLGNLTVNQIIGRIIQTALPIIGALCLAMFFWGGALWLTAGGDEKQMTKARNTLGHAFIGMVIVIGAYVIVFNIVNLLGSTLTATKGK